MVKGRLDTTLCFHIILTFFYCLASRQVICLEGIFKDTLKACFGNVIRCSTQQL